MNRNRAYFTAISYISEKQVKFINQNDEIPFQTQRKVPVVCCVFKCNRLELDSQFFKQRQRETRMCTYKFLTHYDVLYIVFNFTFTTAFYSLSWLAWVSVRLRGWKQSESRVTPHNVINTKQMGERKQLLGKMSVPAFHCNGFTAIIFAGVFGLSVAKSASYRQQSTKNFFFLQPSE